MLSNRESLLHLLRDSELAKFNLVNSIVKVQ